MPLTVLAIQKSKPKDKPYKLSDSAGLYLLITASGGKYWRLKYRFARKEKVLALGVFPEISLVIARQRRDDARKLILSGVDPSEVKREKTRQLVATYDNTFEKVAREWHELKRNKWSEYYSRQVMQRLSNDIFPKIGNRPIERIVASDLLKVAKLIEARDALELSHRAISMCSQIFQYAIITDRALHNPALALRGALKTADRKHRAHLEETDLPTFLEKLEDYDGSLISKMAIQLLMLTFVRPSELCGAMWSEIDLERKQWRIPAERMKMRTPHIVPLATEAIQILTTLKKLHGSHKHVFPNNRTPGKGISTNSLLYVLYELGYKGKATVHGFRGTASTVLNESSLFGRDVIERQLAHQERNRVRAAYDHSDHLPARAKMMQWWSDYLSQAMSRAKVQSYG